MGSREDLFYDAAASTKPRSPARKGLGFFCFCPVLEPPCCLRRRSAELLYAAICGHRQRRRCRVNDEHDGKRMLGTWLETTAPIDPGSSCGRRCTWRDVQGSSAARKMAGAVRASNEIRRPFGRQVRDVLVDEPVLTSEPGGPKHSEPTGRAAACAPARPGS